jgi:hypothetical protein
LNPLNPPGPKSTFLQEALACRKRSDKKKTASEWLVFIRPELAGFEVIGDSNTFDVVHSALRRERTNSPAVPAHSSLVTLLEPIRVLVLHHFADQFSAVDQQAGEDLIDIVDSEHNAAEAEFVHRSFPSPDSVRFRAFRSSATKL